jgi:hypothetical protein
VHDRLVDPADVLRGGPLVETVVEGGAVDEGSLVGDELQAHAAVRTSRPAATAYAGRALVDGDGREHCTIRRLAPPGGPMQGLRMQEACTRSVSVWPVE